MAAEIPGRPDVSLDKPTIQPPGGGSLDVSTQGGLPTVQKGIEHRLLAYTTGQDVPHPTPITDPHVVAEHFRGQPVPKVLQATTVDELYRGVPDDWNPVPLPERYARLVIPHVEMVEEDLTFLQDLDARHRASGAPSTKEARRERYFEATAEVHDHIVDIRGRSESGIVVAPDVSHLPEEEREHVLEAYAATDKNRPSSRRGQLLGMFATHHPLFKRDHTVLHADKIAGALPGFAAEMGDTNFRGMTFREYVDESHRIMTEHVDASTERLGGEPITTAGKVLGVTHDMVYPDGDNARTIFSQIGKGTFFDVYNDIVGNVLVAGGDPQQAVRREFLEQDGMGTMLMHVHLSQFSAIIPSLLYNGVTNYRQYMTSHESMPGLCPASMDMESAEDPSQMRPIAYEFATVLTDNLPKSVYKSPSRVREGIKTLFSR